MAARSDYRAAGVGIDPPQSVVGQLLRKTCIAVGLLYFLEPLVGRLVGIGFAVGVSIPIIGGCFRFQLLSSRLVDILGTQVGVVSNLGFRVQFPYRIVTIFCGSRWGGLGGQLPKNIVVVAVVACRGIGEARFSSPAVVAHAYDMPIVIALFQFSCGVVGIINGSVGIGHSSDLSPGINRGAYRLVAVVYGGGWAAPSVGSTDGFAGG